MALRIFNSLSRLKEVKNYLRSKLSLANFNSSLLRFLISISRRILSIFRPKHREKYCSLLGSNVTTLFVFFIFRILCLIPVQYLFSILKNIFNVCDKDFFLSQMYSFFHFAEMPTTNMPISLRVCMRTMFVRSALLPDERNSKIPFAQHRKSILEEHGITCSAPPIV